MAPTLERRAAIAELRAAGRRLKGYAALFSTDARIGDYTETIAPGAFAASLAAGRDILALVDHDPHQLMARTRNDTLRLAEDSRGLAFELDVANTTLGADILAMAERGDLGGMSFAFTVPPNGERWEGRRRELRSITLHEISVVRAWPAYAGTTIEARACTPRLNRLRRFLETVRA